MRGLMAVCVFVIWTAGSTTAMAQASGAQFQRWCAGHPGWPGLRT